MAFWLCKELRGQEQDFIQRFDPRFWTINFPRPMMASVVSTNHDAMVITCDFRNKGDIAGLIWESEDKHDHPLLAYEHNRDYSRTTLKFHWKSTGIIALNQANGPTLTIEGRDATGAKRTWYVRLWNYAVGTTTDAQITLPFSSLGAGWGLPGQPVHPADIDRMFISLVPPGFAYGSSAPHTAPISAEVIVSNMRCEGDAPLLKIGDVMLPPHGEQMATAYDDSFNQTPARLLRSTRALGYRGRILHYLGMSHFFALEKSPTGAPTEDQGRLLAPADGSLAPSAQAWHKSFFELSKAQGFEVISSLSYELFAAHCPSDWQQRAANGDPGRTGWYPPSALLSPANVNAMNWLKAVATRFSNLMLDAGLPLLFQIGEPWWWIMPDGRPCLYDAAAKAALGGNPPIIQSMHNPLSNAEKNTLDAAGALLANSTLDIAQTVRDLTTDPVEVMVLAFTPTILDPDMPELGRANLPVGWAYPAFDRLQLEDYDWLTDGADANRRAAIAAVDARLGYPLDKQDYLSGFVLNAQDAEEYWPRIDIALNEAKDRGINQRFVWALPQILRDGYTRIAPQKEEKLRAFDDVLYPLALGRNAGVSPEFSTSVAVTASGHEHRSTLWSDARVRYDVGPGIRSENELGTLIAFFRARRGAARGFRLADPFDFSSNGMTGTPTADDQLLGVGDGLRSKFQLVKSYGDGDEPQIREISRPRQDTISISVNGVPITEWTASKNGEISFVQSPAEGAEVRAGFLFDVPVRFAEDRLDIMGANFAAGEAPSVPLIEIRESL